MTRLIAVVLLVVAGASANAADGPPSAASVKQLLVVSEARKLLDAASAQIDSSMEIGMRQAVQGQPITAEQQKVLDDMRVKTVALIREFLTWEQLEPIMADIYTRTFTQNEVDGMLAFYATDAGKAMIAKMPLVMQSSSQAMQARMGTLTPKLVALQQETAQQLQALAPK